LVNENVSQEGQNGWKGKNREVNPNISSKIELQGDEKKKMGKGEWRAKRERKQKMLGRAKRRRQKATRLFKSQMLTKNKPEGEGGITTRWGKDSKIGSKGRGQNPKTKSRRSNHTRGGRKVPTKDQGGVEKNPSNVGRKWKKKGASCEAEGS